MHNGRDGLSFRLSVARGKSNRIAEASNGPLKIQGYWAMRLGGKAPRLLDQARAGSRESLLRARGPQPRLGTNVFTFLLNEESYAKLPPDLKKVIDDNSGRNIANWASQNWADIEALGFKVVASKPKNKSHAMPAAEVEKTKKIGVDGEALVADARSLIDKHSQ